MCVWEEVGLMPAFIGIVGILWISAMVCGGVVLFCVGWAMGEHSIRSKIPLPPEEEITVERITPLPMSKPIKEEPTPRRAM